MMSRPVGPVVSSVMRAVMVTLPFVEFRCDWYDPSTLSVAFSPGLRCSTTRWALRFMSSEASLAVYGSSRSWTRRYVAGDGTVGVNPESGYTLERNRDEAFLLWRWSSPRFFMLVEHIRLLKWWQCIRLTAQASQQALVAWLFWHSPRALHVNAMPTTLLGLD